MKRIISDMKRNNNVSYFLIDTFLNNSDPYIYGNPITGTKDGLYYYDYYGKASDFKERQHSRLWLGPTNAGIHLTYDIIYRKKKQIR